MSLTILIVDDEENARHQISKYLVKKGYTTIEAGTLKEARIQINKGNADIVTLDARLPDGFGPTLLEETASMVNRPPIIMITAYGDVEMAVTAMKNRAHDFFTKPIKLSELEKSINEAGEIVRMRRELDHLRRSQYSSEDFILGSTDALHEVYSQAQLAASHSTSVVITGETGTGKEILARAIHRMGTRSKEQFIGVNCAAIQDTMLETELFGHEAGAFTGADYRKIGLMEVADGGILFLDEISLMSIDLQAKLLRAIEEQAFRRMGGTDLVNVDVQILAASNLDLKKAIEEKKFREDLYFRLKVIGLHLPPLRERLVDLPDFVGFFLSKLNMKMGKNILGVTPKALNQLKKYSWPGNIRELRNILERAVLFCDETEIGVSHLPLDIVEL